MTPDIFAELIRTLGLPLAILIAVLWTGSREMWVWGKSYSEMRDDRDFWRDQALKSTDLARDATEVVRRVRPRRTPT